METYKKEIRFPTNCNLSFSESDNDYYNFQVLMILMFNPINRLILAFKEEKLIFVHYLGFKICKIINHSKIISKILDKHLTDKEHFKLEQRILECI